MKHGISRNVLVVPALLATLMLLPVSAWAVTITGTSGDDVLTGKGGDDTISARAGNDTVSGGSGSDTLGPGNDLLQAGQGTDRVDGQDGDEGDDVIRVGPGKDLIFGEEGVNTLYATNDGVKDELYCGHRLAPVGSRGVLHYIGSEDPLDHVNYCDDVVIDPVRPEPSAAW